MGVKGVSAWMERRLGALAIAGHRRPWVALGIALVLLLAGAGTARGIRLSADLTELLPKSFESVQGLQKLKERFGGMGYVVVVGRGAEPEQLRRFADDLAPQLEALPGIRWVEYQRSTDFFADHALYYMSVEDLEEVQRRIRAREKWERQQRNPLYVQLDEPTPAPSLDFSDIEAKYVGGAEARFAGSGEKYYLDPEARMVVLLAKPASHSADLGFSKQILSDVEALLARQDLAKYGPGFDVALTGTFQKKIDQQNQIAGDVATASTVALLLMLGYLFFHFRSVVAIGLGLAPVGLGLVLTYGFVGIAYGQVNLLTAFLGAILGGLGVEHGIHLLGRYQALRSEGVAQEEATREAFAETGSGALVSASVAALTFLSIAVSEFRAFREFGVIAAVGMLLLVAAYVLVLPATLSLAARWGIEPKSSPSEGRWTAALGWGVFRFRRPLAWAGSLVTVALVVAAVGIRFDYDFGALEDGDLPSFQLDKQVNRILGHSQTPVVLLTEDPEDERAVVRELKARKERNGAASTIDFVGSLDDLVPDRQEEKREIIARIGRTLARVDREDLDPEMRPKFDAFLRATKAQPFGHDDLPVAIRRQFEGTGTHASGFVLVYPRISLADGARVRALAEEVRGIPLASGKTLSASGEPMVLADILEMVTSEAPIVLVAALLSVLVAMWITLGSLGTALLCLAPTVVSILALAGTMALAGLPFNYLNILVVPVLIGTTVDAGVHLMMRLSRPGAGFVSVYAETGRAIIGGLLTSAFGFGALMLADHPGLNSVGAIANLGFTVNLAVMLAVFPAVLLLRSSHQPVPAPVSSLTATEQN